MGKGKIFLAFLLICNFVARSQSRYGIKAGIGISGAKYSINFPNGYENHSYMPSAQVGFFYQNTFKNKFVIGAEVNINQFNTKENGYTNYEGMNICWDPGPDPKSVKGEHKSFSSGLQPSFNMGYTFKKFTGTAGLGFNYAFYNQNMGQSTVTYTSDNVFTNRYNDGYFTHGLPSAANFTFGIRLGGGYMINNKMSLGVSYSKFNGYKSNQFLAEMRYFIR